MDQLLIAPFPLQEKSWTLTDEEFLKSLEWGKAGGVAPLRNAARQGNVKEFAKLLQQRLRRQFSDLKAKKDEPAESAMHRVLWSQRAFEDSPRSRALIELVAQFDSAETSKPARTAQRRKKAATKRTGREGTDAANLDAAISRWLDALDGADVLAPIEPLVLADLLGCCRLSRGTAFRVWRALFAAIDPELLAEESTEPRLTDRDLVAKGELPWVLSMLFPGLKLADELRARGQSRLRDALMACTDESGVPRADRLERLSFWMAVFVRARDWGARSGLRLWDAKCERRFRLLAHAATMLCRADGRLAMSNGFVSNSVPLLLSASKLAGLPEHSPARSYLKILSSSSVSGRGGRRRGGLRSRRRARRPSVPATKSAIKFPAAQSDDSRLACLRSNWSAEADAIVVAHDEVMPRIELSALGKLLFSGHWDVAVTVDSVPLEFTSGWGCVCWFSDEDADYIELRTDHPAGVRVERQILLSREEHFALFAEIVSAPAGAKIECESRLVPVTGATLVPDRPTRECLLKVPGCTARIYPMMLPAERVIGAAGSLGLVDDALQYRQTGIGGMYAPIVIDWHPDRTRAYAEWRKLTVSEQGKAVPGDVAGGCRLRVGTDQWLFYHGMKKSHGGRAVLGQHTFNETLIGYFTKDGTVDPIVLVEQGEV